MSSSVHQESVLRLEGDRDCLLGTTVTAVPEDSAKIRYHSMGNALQTIQQELEKHTDNQSLLSISARLVNQMEDCCRSDSQTMLPSFINRFPDGTETGEFLCLEIGGSTLRAALVRLQDIHGPTNQSVEVVDMQSWPITKELKMSKAPTFVRWIAQTAAQVVKQGPEASANGEQVGIRTCLTWSFPFEQQAIDRGNILSCGKGFLVFDELVGCDIGALLHDAFSNEGLLIHLKAIVNDTVAGLLAGHRDEPSMHTSIVLGTGINAAVAVPVSKIDARKFSRYPPEWSQVSSYVLVNTELSLLGGTIFTRTVWDSALIQNVPGGSCLQPLEYLCSGYYIGEIVRVILVSVIHSGCLFSGRAPEKLLLPFSFESSLVATLEGDSTQDLSISAAALARSFTWPSHRAPSLMELRMMKAIAHSVSLRAAGYTAASIYALSTFVQSIRGTEDASNGRHLGGAIVVGVSGAVFESLPGFKATCEKVLNEMAEHNVGDGCETVRFVLKHVAHGGIIGSAVAAALRQ